MEFTKDDVKQIIKTALEKNQYSIDGLAWLLGISTSTLRGYKSKGYLPMPIFTQLKAMIENPGSIASMRSNLVSGNKGPLSNVTTEALSAELESRGWNVELTRRIVENVDADLIAGFKNK